MRNLFITFFLVFTMASFGQGKFEPVANNQAIITSGKVRFTVLSPIMIRMEWDSLGKFENHASFVVINRALPLPKYSKKEDGKSIQIITDKLSLTYKKSAEKFSPQNLQIVFTNNNNKTIWKPGTLNKENLHGTTRTLDGCNGGRNWNGDTIKLEEGIISRDGWYLIDDSKDFLFDNSDWPWVLPREEGNRLDWYFIGYGIDYKAALLSYTKIAGKIPIPPKYAFGYWWSRYWSYNDQELRELVANMKKYDLPLDVLVIDMDWHKTDNLSWVKPVTDEFNQSEGWTGFTWNKNLFPDPGKFLTWVKNQNLSITMNLHPASGVAPWEDAYPAFAKAMNFDTTGHKNIPFEIADKKFATNYFNILLRPLEKQGVDFWWIDWQQWPFSKKYKNLSNTWWLNYCHFTDMERNSQQRPMLYHRWGGLGNHRYQIGFSGDTWITWNSLAYQPFFTATASNVCYGYWSHDIGGHEWGGLPAEQQKMQPELTTRWTQFGVFSPILRHHSTKNPSIYKEAWLYPFEYDVAIHDAINLRYTLFPYIYTAAREAYETGLSIVRPMYYEYPDMSEAYEYKNQYFFGDNMIVAPVITPIPTGEHTASVKVWLPAGQWYEWFTGTMLEGGKIYERKFLINEIPVYIKAGAIIPMYPKIKNLRDTVSELVINVFPGGSFKTRVYEDNGFTNEYTKSDYAFTGISTETNADNIKLTISPREGNYSGALNSRSYHIKFTGSLIPEKVMVEGKEYSYSAFDAAKTGNWAYTADDLTLHVFVPETSVNQELNVNVSYPAESASNSTLLNDKIGIFNRYKMAAGYLKVEWGFVDAGPLPDIITQTEQTTTRIQYSPKTLIQELKQFDVNMIQIPATVNTMNLKQESKEEFMKYLK
jgi:alpha-glucosidase (family GH31 glycosyl hydrolase)